jgi:hypothetical protein
MSVAAAALRRKIEASLSPDELGVVLNLDKAARERDQRRRGGQQPGVWSR